MEEQELRNIVVATGPELLREGLVARTWGNISARVDDTHYLITPSGMDYEKLTADDLVLCDRVRGTFEGQNRPSSERGIHAIAYELFPEVGFVIHTHQVYATALGLAGFQRGSFTGDERVRLGGAAVAGYGLSGSKKLQAGVRAAMETGAHIVFMPHHGALICGRDHEEAMQRAKLLETLCRRCWRGTLTQEAVLPAGFHAGKGAACAPECPLRHDRRAADARGAAKTAARAAGRYGADDWREDAVHGADGEQYFCCIAPLPCRPRAGDRRGSLGGRSGRL